MGQQLAVRTSLPAADVDFLRAFARAQGYGNTSSGTVRFAIHELARRLRRENERADRSAQSVEDRGTKERDAPTAEQEQGRGD